MCVRGVSWQVRPLMCIGPISTWNPTHRDIHVVVGHRHVWVPSPLSSSASMCCTTAPFKKCFAAPWAVAGPPLRGHHECVGSSVLTAESNAPAMNFPKIIDSMANRYNRWHVPKGFAAVFARGGEEISMFVSLDSSVHAEGASISKYRMQIDGMYL